MASADSQRSQLHTSSLLAATCFLERTSMACLVEKEAEIWTLKWHAENSFLASNKGTISSELSQTGCFVPQYEHFHCVGATMSPSITTKQTISNQSVVVCLEGPCATSLTILSSQQGLRFLRHSALRRTTSLLLQEPSCAGRSEQLRRWR